MTTAEILKVRADLAQQRRENYLKFFFDILVIGLVYLAFYKMTLEVTDTVTKITTKIYLDKVVSILLWMVAIWKSLKTVSNIIHSKEKENQLEKLFYKKESAEKAMEELGILTPPEE